MIRKTPNFIDEPTLPSFADVPIESFSKFVHFTNASRDLMIKCLQGGFVPTFNQIHESDASFRPLTHTHGRPIDSNDSHHVIERWRKIQESVKVINIGDRFGLSPLKDSKDREIPSIENWSLIVQSSNVDSCGKHLTFCTILSKIRKNWSLDTRVGGISSTYIEKCLQSCECLNAQLWDEVHNVPIEELDVTLDKLCESHLVLRRWVRTYQGKSHVLKYYRCHRSGKKGNQSNLR